MTTIYFAGQDNLGNRGCEALIRSTIKTIRQQLPEATFLIPTRNMSEDAAQWPDHGQFGASFVEAEPYHGSVRWWVHARRRFPLIEWIPPAYKISNATRSAIENSDVLIMTGGDIISLDYGLESLHYWARICESAINMGKPAVLWAASIGPFTKYPATEARMKRFLSRFSLITVRESASLEYMEKQGFSNVKLVADPAFVLDHDPFAANNIAILQNNVPVLGFNVSPLIRKFRGSAEEKSSLDQEVTQFLIETLSQKNLNILLIPHVDPLDGSDDNSDSACMASILAKVRTTGFEADRIDMLPRTLNTAELKGVIRQCAYFMGARTHATVAALSQGIPTTSIAYSIKAKGINQDLFGHTRYVLETPDVTVATLKQHLSTLESEGDQIREFLNTRLTEWKARAGESGRLLAQIITTKQGEN